MTGARTPYSSRSEFRILGRRSRVLLVLLSGTAVWCSPLAASAQTVSAFTLAIFEGSIDECDTPLGNNIPELCPWPAAASSIRSPGLDEGGSSTVLQVSRARARTDRQTAVEVKTERAIAVGSSGLAVTPTGSPTARQTPLILTVSVDTPDSIAPRDRPESS
jgi:hypothetical protein